MRSMFVVINCGPSAPFIGPCLASLRAQTYKQWRALVTVDPCGDRTADEAEAAAKGDARIEVLRNDRRRYSLENLVNAVRRSPLDPEDILVNLDGDDRLSHAGALATVAATYARSGCWMTYGSWVSDGPGAPRGLWPAYPDDTENFRAAPWRATHLRTWARWLWDAIDDRDLRDDDGHYFRAACDVAAAIPLLETCGTARARHVNEPLCVLNRRYSWRTDDARFLEQRRNEQTIRARPPYPRLGERLP